MYIHIYTLCCSGNEVNRETDSMSQLICDDGPSPHGRKIGPILCNIECPRSVWNRAAVVYHMTCAKLEIDLSESEVFAACMSHALKECCASTSLPSLLEMRRNLNEVNVAAAEMLIFEYVRPHVILIESCMRLQLKTLSVHAPQVHSNRESIGRLSLALSQKLYLCSFCLFPETCARACLLAACSLFPITVDCSMLPAEFRSPLTNRVHTYLLSTGSLTPLSVFSGH